MSGEAKKFRQMSDDEIIKAFKDLAHGCQRANDPVATFKKTVKSDFDCSYTVAITFSKYNSAGQRMHMGMVCSPTTGETLNF
ncbi:hypothetical protein LCGC14_2638230 [marine sediment metagenome]|uniref:Uncharacterized protein n=1 Tax=marine sediment metagenome TaxID=412755 RepID=A0A0F8ZYH3_9ZZZZ